MYAAYLLLQVINENPNVNNDGGVTQFWTIVLNSEKSVFLNEKLLTQFSDDGLLFVIQNLFYLTQVIILF